MTHLRFSGLAVALAGLTLVAGTTASPARAQPASTTATAGAESVDAAQKAPCQFGSASARMRPAMADIQRLGRGEFKNSYAGLRVCTKPGRVLVFREPNRAFDRAVLRLAASHKVRVQIVTAAASYAEMERIVQEVDNRREKLQAQHVRVSRMSRLPEGLVRVGVQGDLDAARRVLRGIPHLIVERGGVAPA